MKWIFEEFICMCPCMLQTNVIHIKIIIHLIHRKQCRINNRSSSHVHCILWKPRHGPTLWQLLTTRKPAVTEPVLHYSSIARRYYGCDTTRTASVRITWHEQRFRAVMWTVVCVLWCVYCGVCIMVCLLCCVYYGVSTVLCVLCYVYSAMCTLLCVLCCVYCAVCIVCTVLCVLCCVYRAVCTVLCVLCVLCCVYCAVCTVLCVLCCVYCAVCTVLCVPCYVYCAVCTEVCVIVCTL